MFEYVVCDNWSLGCQGVLVPFVQLCTMSRALVFRGADPFVGDWATALVTGKVTGQNLPNEENLGVAEDFELLLPERVKLIHPQQVADACYFWNVGLLQQATPGFAHFSLGPQRNATGLQ